jgi:hypothetical protein
MPSCGYIGVVYPAEQPFKKDKGVSIASVGAARLKLNASKQNAIEVIDLSSRLSQVSEPGQSFRAPWSSHQLLVHQAATRGNWD